MSTILEHMVPADEHSRRAGAWVRDASRTDCARFADIYNQAIASARSTMDTEPVDARYFRQLFDTMSAREQLLAAEVAGEVVGWGIVKRYSDRPGYRVACETSLYVDEAAAGRGLGSTLLTELVARAAALGYRHLVAKILSVNEGSIRFHRRHGFELVGVQRQIGELMGRGHDVTILQRILDDPFIRSE